MKETIRTSPWDTKKRQAFFGPYRRPQSAFWDWMVVGAAISFLFVVGYFMGGK